MLRVQLWKTRRRLESIAGLDRRASLAPFQDLQAPWLRTKILLHHFQSPALPSSDEPLQAPIEALQSSVTTVLDSSYQFQAPF
jgi:hypothetical protein